MIKKVLGFTVVGIILVSLCGCVLLGPNPKVVSTKLEKGFDGLNAVSKFKITIKNEGKAGNVKISVNADGDKGTYYNDEKVVYFNEGETKTVVFVIDSKYGEKLSVHYNVK